MNNLSHASEEGIFIVKSGPQKWNFGQGAEQLCKNSKVKMLLKGKV
jgi:hypothetical protein